MPKLTADVPNDLLRKTGVADEELTKKEMERGRKRKLDEDVQMDTPKKRSRSTSSYSSSSVSTISTNISRSPSPKIPVKSYTGQSQSLAGLELSRKRRRSPSTSMSYTSESSLDKPNRGRSQEYLRAEQHRRLASTEDPRRKRHLDDHSGNRPTSPERTKGRYSRSRSSSYASDSSSFTRRRTESLGKDRSKRRRRASYSPQDRGRERDMNSNRGSRQARSPLESRDRSKVTRHRKSMTPQLSAGKEDRRRPQDRYRRIDRSDASTDKYKHNGSNVTDQSGNHKDVGRMPKVPPPQKERSLSPFSKRVALTQAMNLGH